MILSSYLRVYMTMDGPPRWREHVPPRTGSRVITIGEMGIWQETLAEDAFGTEWGGRRWVCPRRPRLRMLEGLLAFRNAYPGAIGTTLAPERVVVRAAVELEAMREREPEMRSHILTASWHVPLRWFAAFDAGERELGESADGSTSIRYRTGIDEARRRLDYAMTTLTEAGFDDSVVAPVADVAGWLESFEADAMVELDYGTVAGMFSDGELALDDSAADVSASLDALAAGDMEQAGSFYASAARRWAGAQAVAFAN